jgi:hypothetical protein
MNPLSLINVLLLIYLLAFPLFLEYNKRFAKGKKPWLNKLVKYGRKYHPIAGVALILLGMLHGYMKLNGQLSFHTGSLLLLLLVINGFIGFAYKKSRKKSIALVHRISGVAILLSFILHYVRPWIFSGF